jgi:hypothetical protein
MKKLSMLLASVILGLFVSGMAVAETLKVIIPGGGTGSYNTRFQILKPEIEKVWGDKVKVIWANNCTRAKVMINKESGPTITIWSTEYNLDEQCSLPVSGNRILAVEKNYLRVCTSFDSGRTAHDFVTPGNKWTVAHSDPHAAYATWFKEFNAATGLSVVATPYEGSGAARRGVLAGDIDFVFISPSNSNKLMQQGGFCFYTTSPVGEPRHNLPPLSAVFPTSVFPKSTIHQGYYYPAFNVPGHKLHTLRVLFDDVANGRHTKFTEFMGTKDIFMQGISNLTDDEMLKFMEDTKNLWK